MQFQIPHEHRNASGIYAISNLINSKVYIGSAVNFNQRFMNHVSYCKRGKQNSKFQRAINKYGIEKFAFNLIELCDKLELIKREQYWIDRYDSYKSGYNGVPIAGSCLGMKVNLTNEQREKVRERNRIFKTGTKASEETKIKMRLARIGRKHSEETIAKLIERKKCKMKEVEQLDLSGNVIAVWPSTASCTKAGFYNISRAVKRQQLNYGFIWRYKNEGQPLQTKPRTLKPQNITHLRFVEKSVIQFDRNGNVLNRFVSGRDAVRKTGVDGAHISLVCKGVRKTAGGFVWRFAA